MKEPDVQKKIIVDTKNNSKPLLTDTISYFDLDTNFAKQQIEKKDGVVTMTGIFQRADIPNQNQRIYPKYILEREVDRLLPLIADNQLVGALDHPDSAIIEFSNASHKIVNLWWEGNNLFGRLQILKGHPSGDKVLALIENGVKIGISSRGLGTTISAESIPEYSHYKGVDVVTDDFQLLTADLVSNPSTHGAFLVTEQLMLEWNIQYSNKLNKEDNYVLSEYDKKLINFIEKYSTK